MPSKPRLQKSGLTYADSGVSIVEGDAFAESIGGLLRRTHGPRVLPNPGGFAGLLRLDFNEKLFARNYRDPVLVAATDGVGTKIKLAIQLDTYDTVGIDLVAMCVNDLIVEGAEPLLFLDYIAVPKVDKAILYDIVKGVSKGCEIAGCALLGGETAMAGGFEIPGVGTKAVGRGGAYTVGVRDLTSLHHNPANLALLDGSYFQWDHNLSLSNLTFARAPMSSGWGEFAGHVLDKGQGRGRMSPRWRFPPPPCGRGGDIKVHPCPSTSGVMIRPSFTSARPESS